MLSKRLVQVTLLGMFSGLGACASQVDGEFDNQNSAVEAQVGQASYVSDASILPSSIYINRNNDGNQGLLSAYIGQPAAAVQWDVSISVTDQNTGAVYFAHQKTVEPRTRVTVPTNSATMLNINGVATLNSGEQKQFIGHFAVPAIVLSNSAFTVAEGGYDLSFDAQSIGANLAMQGNALSQHHYTFRSTMGIVPGRNTISFDDSRVEHVFTNLERDSVNKYQGAASINAGVQQNISGVDYVVDLYASNVGLSFPYTDGVVGE